MKPGNLLLTLVLMLLLALSVMAQGNAPTPSAEPKLVIASFTHDFGEVKAGTPLTHSFVVKNEGKNDLLIKSVSPSCGCTASNFDKVVSPGKTGKITLSVEHTEALVGEFAKGATVKTNDPQYPTFNLVLRAFIKGSAVAPQPTPGTETVKPGSFSEAGRRVGTFSVSPHDRWVTTTIRGTSSSITLYIYNHENKPVRVKEVIPGGDGFVTRWQPIQEGKRYELAISTNANLAPGVHKQTLKVLTDSKQTPEIAIELEATVFANVFASPTSITLPALPFEIDPSTVALPPIYVRKVREGGLQVKLVHSSLPFLRLKVTNELEGRTYKIEMAFDKARMTSRGDFKGVIRIETNDPDAPVIEIPIQGSFK